MDNYNVFKRSFIDLLDVQSKLELESMQLVSFKYGSSNEKRLALILDAFPDSQNIHAVKLNHLTFSRMNAFFNKLIDTNKLRLYSEAYVRNIFNEVFRMNKYRLPLLLPEDIGPISFYNTYIKNRPIMKHHNAYRQYNLDKMDELQIVFPNLKLLDLMPRGLRIDESYTDIDRAEFLKKHGIAVDRNFELGVEEPDIE